MFMEGSFMKRIIVKTAAILLALLLAGCSGDTTWAYENGGDKMPTGVYVMFEISAVAAAGTRLGELSGNPAYTTPAPAQLLKETIDGVPGADYVASETTKRVKEYYAVKAQFEQRGLALTESEAMAAENAVASVLGSNRDFYEGNGVAESSVREYYMASARKTNLFNFLYGEGGEREVPVAELEKHLAGNYYMADVVPIYKPFYGSSNDEGVLEKELEATKAFAENGLEELKGGKAIEEIAYELMLRSAGEDEAARAAVTKPGTEDLRMVLRDSDRGTYGDAFIDTLKATPVGECAMVEDETFFILFKRVDILADAETLPNFRPMLLNELRGEEFDSELAALGEGLQLTENADVLTRYAAGKLKLDIANSN
jgi:hypothetical protein